MSQSSNDSFPTAMHIAAAHAHHRRSDSALSELHRELRKKEKAFARIVKIGRTHTQDATPLTLGQEFSGYAAQVESGIARLRVAVKDLFPLAQGGTAAAPASTRNRNSATCSQGTSPGLQGCRSRVPPGIRGAGLQRRLCAGARRDHRRQPACSRSPTTFASWGYRARVSGLGELILPENEPGSSIMPGKVNPTQCEAMTMVCCQVFGNQTAVTVAGSQGLGFRIERLQAGAGILYDEFHPIAIGRWFSLSPSYCVGGYTRRRKTYPRFDGALTDAGDGTRAQIGYDNAAKVAKSAHARGTTLKEEAVRLGFVAAARVRSPGAARQNDTPGLTVAQHPGNYGCVI